MSEMFKYLEEHNYISRNKNKSPLRQRELSVERASCIVAKYDNLTCELQQENKKLKKDYDKAVHKATYYESEVYRLQEENKAILDNIKQWIREEIKNSDVFIDVTSNKIKKIGARSKSKTFLQNEIFKHKFANHYCKEVLSIIEELERNSNE